MPQTVIQRLASMLLPLLLLAACQALPGGKDRSSTDLAGVDELKPGQPSEPRQATGAGQLPCSGNPINGDHPVMVLYFFRDGYVDVSAACPGGKAYNGMRPPRGDVGGDLDFDCGANDPCDLKKALRAVEYFTDKEDPCYRVNIGGTWYYRCY